MKKKLLMEFINLYEITRWMKKKKEEAKKNLPNETIKCNETNESDEYSPSYDSRKVKNHPQALTSKDENENQKYDTDLPTIFEEVHEEAKQNNDGKSDEELNERSEKSEVSQQIMKTPKHARKQRSENAPLFNDTGVLDDFQQTILTCPNKIT